MSPSKQHPRRSTLDMVTWGFLPPGAETRSIRDAVRVPPAPGAIQKRFFSARFLRNHQLKKYCHIETQRKACRRFTTRLLRVPQNIAIWRLESWSGARRWHRSKLECVVQRAEDGRRKQLVAPWLMLLDLYGYHSSLEKQENCFL